MVVEWLDEAMRLQLQFDKPADGFKAPDVMSYSVQR